MDFTLATPTEICTELGLRLKTARQAKGIQQGELAARTGVSRNTLMALESHGQGTLVTLVRVASALGLIDQLQSIFVMQIQSIAQLELRAKPAPQRIRKSRKVKS